MQRLINSNCFCIFYNSGSQPVRPQGQMSVLVIKSGPKLHHTSMHSIVLRATKLWAGGAFGVPFKGMATHLPHQNAWYSRIITQGGVQCGLLCYK